MEDSAELLHIDGEGAGTECVSLVAIGTTDGNVEVVTVGQGALQPLAFSPVSSFKVTHLLPLCCHRYMLDHPACCLAPCLLCSSWAMHHVSLSTRPRSLRASEPRSA